MRFAIFATFVLALSVSAGTPEKPEGRVQDVGQIPAGTETNSVVEKQYEKLLEADDDAQAEVDEWIKQHREFQSKGAGTDEEGLTKRIRERFAPVRKGYEDFLAKHPAHTRARVAYASFLGDIESEDAAREQLEKALTYDTNSPAIYNNLANIHGHTGELKKAFELYAKAIQLDPDEPVYYHNFGTTVYLFRKDAQEFYKINEQEVFNKAFGLYSNALRLDPTNFPLASDVAQTYYGVKPFRAADALHAWTNAMKLAADEIEREGVHVHFARVKMLDGKLDEARKHLNGVTNAMYAELKARLLTSIDKREAEAAGTNAVTVAPTNAASGSTAR